MREALATGVGMWPGDPSSLDLCCGSGAVGVAVGDARTATWSCTPSDLDPASRRRAPAGTSTASVARSCTRATCTTRCRTSLRGRVDVLVANAPYVPTGELAFMPVEAREHEPRIALDGGADGVEIQRRVVAGAREWLAPGGHLLVETSERQVPLTVAAFESAGFAVRVATDDDLDATVVVGRIVRLLRVTTSSLKVVGNTAGFGLVTVGGIV